MRLDGKISASVDVASGVPQGIVFKPLFILHTCELFHIVGNYIVGYADDTTIYAVIPTHREKFCSKYQINLVNSIWL